MGTVSCVLPITTTRLRRMTSTSPFSDQTLWYAHRRYSPRCYLPPKDGEKYFALLRVSKINGIDPQDIRDRVPFDYLTPLFPMKFKLTNSPGRDIGNRMIDPLPTG